MKLAHSFWDKYLLLLAGVILFTMGILITVAPIFFSIDIYLVSVLVGLGILSTSIGMLCLLLNYISGRTTALKRQASIVVSEWQIAGSTVILLAGISLLWYLTQSTQSITIWITGLVTEVIVMMIGVKIITGDHWFKACKLGFYMTTSVYIVPLSISILAYFTAIQKLLSVTQAGLVVLICSYLYLPVIGLLYYFIFRHYHPAISARKAAIGIIISMCVTLLLAALNPMRINDQELYQNLKKQLQANAKTKNS